MAKDIVKNWSGNVSFQPSSIQYPSTQKEIQDVILKAANDKQKIRVIGTGHSFSNLIETEQILVSLDEYQGLLSVDKEKLQATVKAGTKLKLLGELLFKEGLAMENLGDIDVQSVAGAISTGTHGTGTSFGVISSQVVALKMVNGKGEVLSCSSTKNADLFKAAQVSLGALGILTEVTLQCVPSYKLLITNSREPLDNVLETLEERKDKNRNFEYFWFPYTKTAWTKSSNIVDSGEPNKDNVMNHLSELVLENYTLKGLCEIARMFPSKNQFVSKVTAKFAPNSTKLSLSHNVFATVRLVKFTEMEYGVPAEAYQDVMKEVIAKVNTGKFKIHFPVENRWTKKDDILMSPSYGRDSAFIACHVYNKKDNKAYFKAMETIFRAHGGRPHWGKMNTITQNEVVDLYPEFAKFSAIRNEQDPDRIFTNPYLEKILG